LEYRGVEKDLKTGTTIRFKFKGNGFWADYLSGCKGRIVEETPRGYMVFVLEGRLRGIKYFVNIEDTSNIEVLSLWRQKIEK